MPTEQTILFLGFSDELEKIARAKWRIIAEKGGKLLKKLEQAGLKMEETPLGKSMSMPQARGEVFNPVTRRSVKQIRNNQMATMRGGEIRVGNYALPKGPTLTPMGEEPVGYYGKLQKKLRGTPAEKSSTRAHISRLRKEFKARPQEAFVANELPYGPEGASRTREVARSVLGAHKDFLRGQTDVRIPAALQKKLNIKAPTEKEVPQTALARALSIKNETDASRVAKEMKSAREEFKAQGRPAPGSAPKPKAMPPAVPELSKKDRAAVDRVKKMNDEEQARASLARAKKVLKEEKTKSSPPAPKLKAPKERGASKERYEDLKREMRDEKGKATPYLIAGGLAAGATGGAYLLHRRRQKQRELDQNR